jgi:hypothetical protein
MTLIMARQLGDRIIMHSDSMISDPNAPRSDIIPGQLKAIVLTPQLSVAYAGLVQKALPTIREARRMARQGTTLRDVVEYLRQATIAHSGAVDFLVAAHYDEPVLYKIWRGNLVSGADHPYWIGNRTTASAVQRAMQEQQVPADREWAEQEELRSSLAFTNVIRESKIPGVGGFSFNLLGSPEGHCYQDEAGYFGWDRVNVSDINTPEYQHFIMTGTAHYLYRACRKTPSREWGASWPPSCLSLRVVFVVLPGPMPLRLTCRPVSDPA